MSRADRNALFFRRRAEAGLGPAPGPAPPDTGDPDRWPLSDPQRRILRACSGPAGGTAYHNAVCLRLTGPLDVPALERSLRALVGRHALWRARLIETPDGPAQEVRADTALDLRRLDRSRVPAALRGPALDEVATALVREPFDLTDGPPLRTGLVRFAETDHALVLVAHHLIADGWTVGLIRRELVTLYETGGREDGPARTPSYGAYVSWQRRWLDGAEAAAQRRHWQPRLADYRSSSTGWGTGDGDRVTVALPADLARAVAPVCRDQGVTPFALLLAAFGAAVADLQARAAVIVGTPMAVRPEPWMEAVIGCCVNLQPVTVDVSDRPRGRALVQRVWRACLEASAHRALCVERHVLADHAAGLGAAPLFPVVFELTGQLPGAAAPFGELAVRSHPVFAGAVRYASHLVLGPNETGAGEAPAQGTLFHHRDGLAAADLLPRFVGVLRQLVAEPDAPVRAARAGRGHVRD